MSDILELIDNAIAGSTSDDAMRWTPEPPKPTAPDPEKVRAVLVACGARVTAMIEAIRPAIEAWGRELTKTFRHLAKVLPVIEQIQAERRARVSRMHAAYGRRRR